MEWTRHVCLCFILLVIVLLRDNSHTIEFTHLKSTTQWFFSIFIEYAAVATILEHLHHPSKEIPIRGFPGSPKVKTLFF